MKRHPILIGIVVIGAFLVVFFLSVLLVMHTSGGVNTVFSMGDRIAVVKVKGVIKESKPIIDQLLRFMKDGSVKAIVLRIDSPGGGVGPSQEIYEEVRKIGDKKKVVVSMGSVAASGGYYIACAADKIVANPGTIIGSIGVIIEFANVEELVKKIGFKSVIIKSGEYKDVMSPFRSVTEQEERMLQEVIDNVHNQFIEAIAEGRNLTKEEVTAIADGRIFSGEQAKALGLVDSLGNLQDAISMAAKMVGIKGEPKVVYPPKKKLSILDFILRGTVKAIIDYLKGEGSQFNYLSGVTMENLTQEDPHCFFTCLSSSIGKFRFATYSNIIRPVQ